MLVFAATLWLLARYWPLLSVLSPPYTRIGWAVMVLAIAPAAAAFHQFLRARTTIDPHRPQKATVLVTSGVYAWTRNPMYLGLWLVLLGWAIMLGALSGLIGALLFIPFIGWVQIRVEEQALRQRFGEPYERYCRRVHRWFGRGRVD